MAIVMNKVATKSKRALRFEDLRRGDIFMGQGGNWYMKTYDIHDVDGDFMANAVALSDGCFVEFDDEETVTKLKKNIVFDYSNDDIIEWYE